MPEEAGELVKAAMELPQLRLRGLMTIPQMASETHDPGESYEQMRRLYSGLQDAGADMDTLSMGMSGDLESAILHGSTMVRVGTDLLGPRPTD
jgi:uncharacterized pyridoxal phosphate-containing UPF0001 family protein